MSFELTIAVTDEQEKFLAVTADLATSNAPEGVNRGVPTPQEYLQARIDEILDAAETRVQDVNHAQRADKLLKLGAAELEQVDALLGFTKAEDKPTKPVKVK